VAARGLANTAAVPVVIGEIPWSTTLQSLLGPASAVPKCNAVSVPHGRSPFGIF